MAAPRELPELLALLPGVDLAEDSDASIGYLLGGVGVSISIAI